ncbi:MAG TPA: hypothetical protein ENH40_07065 [Nitrospirae bacterium]|nr:hypothetical protein [Nitrospirota bacterium]
MKRFALTVTLLIFVLSGCATNQAKKTTDKRIDPRSSHEECIELLPSQTIVYLFKSSEPVKFNVHYDNGKKVMYPVSQGRVSSWWDEFRPEKEDRFCLLWENIQSYHITLYFEYQIMENKK